MFFFQKWSDVLIWVYLNDLSLSSYNLSCKCFMPPDDCRYSVRCLTNVNPTFKFTADGIPEIPHEPCFKYGRLVFEQAKLIFVPWGATSLYVYQVYNIKIRNKDFRVSTTAKSAKSISSCSTMNVEKKTLQFSYFSFIVKKACWHSFKFTSGLNRYYDISWWGLFHIPMNYVYCDERCF